jgi:hypothetical protein
VKVVNKEKPFDLDHLLFADFRPNQCPKQPIRRSEMSDPESEGDSIIVGPWTQAGRNLEHYFGNLVRTLLLLSQTIVPLFPIYFGNNVGPHSWPGDGELIPKDTMLKLAYLPDFPNKPGPERHK